MRSGDEPANARSPLRLRAALAGLGVVAAVVGVGAFLKIGEPAMVWLFAALGALAVVDLVVVLRQIRQGPHFQPGRSIPPYRPAAQDTPARTRPAPPSEGTRMRRYFAIMGTCLVLITVAWVWVRLWSTELAVAMSIVAAVLPPVAAIVANYDVRLPDDPRPDPDAPGPHPPPDGNQR